MINCLFESINGKKLYAGRDEGDGKFTGSPVVGNTLKGPMKVGIKGTKVADLVGEPIRTDEESNFTVLPGERDIHIVGSSTLSLGLYLTKRAQAEADASTASRSAEARQDGGGDDKPKTSAKPKGSSKPRTRKPSQKTQNDQAAKKKAQEAAE